MANHKSLNAFQKQLKEMGISLSTSKLRKILITGGCWTTERSREVAELFAAYTAPATQTPGRLPGTAEAQNAAAGTEDPTALSADAAVRRIAQELNVSVVTVSINLPYQNVVYNLENRSSNAVRCARYKKRKKEMSGGQENEEMESDIRQ